MFRCGLLVGEGGVQEGKGEWGWALVGVGRGSISRHTSSDNQTILDIEILDFANFHCLVLVFTSYYKSSVEYIITF